MGFMNSKLNSKMSHMCTTGIITPAASVSVEALAAPHHQIQCDLQVISKLCNFIKLVYGV